MTPESEGPTVPSEPAASELGAAAPEAPEVVSEAASSPEQASAEAETVGSTEVAAAASESVDPASADATPASTEDTSDAASNPESGSDSDAASVAHEGDAATGESGVGAEGGAAANEGGDGAEAGPPTGDKKKKKKRNRKKRRGTKPGEATRPASERAPFHVGEEVFGKVTAVLDEAIMVDLGGKALAIFDRQEMETDDLVPEVGDRFVARVHNDGARGGLVVLTRKPLREEEIKPVVEAASTSGDLIKGLVTGVIKGGVEVDVAGLRAFAPASGMDLHPNQANFAALLGQRMEFKVVQYKSQGRDVVVTRRPMLEAEAHERRKHALTLLTEGQVVKGVVRTVVEWGAFVALPEAENLEGLVHISEASHDHRAVLADLMKPGDAIEVQITKIDEKGKIWLSRKALIEDPWAEAKAKYSPGSRHTGKVVRLEDFGAFITLEQGVDGLIHVADLAFDRVEHPSKLLTEGQDVEVVVHHFDNKYKRIALHPAPPPERAEEPQQKVARNASIQVEVVKAESAGVVVRVLGVTGRAARGFIPAGQTGTSRGTDLRKHFRAGARLEVKVIDVDPRRGEPKLSIRALKDDEEKKAHREYRKQLQKEGGFGTLGDLLRQRLSGDDS
ncbi:MAG: S1 RNA-binding domain-containing protein [Polyangiaceae bacterium]